MTLFTVGSWQRPGPHRRWYSPPLLIDWGFSLVRIYLLHRKHNTPISSPRGLLVLWRIHTMLPFHCLSRLAGHHADGPLYEIYNIYLIFCIIFKNNIFLPHKVYILSLISLQQCLVIMSQRTRKIMAIHQHGSQRIKMIPHYSHVWHEYNFNCYFKTLIIQNTNSNRVPYQIV